MAVWDQRLPNPQLFFLSGGDVSWMLDTTSSVDLNFAGGRYFPDVPANLLTCSRLSTAYATNADGTLTSFANNVLRIGVGTGLLVEESRTNVCTYSQDANNMNWGRVTATVNTIAAPDGTVTADTVTDDTTATNSHYIAQAPIPVTVNTTYTASVYVKAGGGPNGGRYIMFTWESNASNGYIYTYWDIVAGTSLGNQFANGAVYSSSSITVLANGWVRLTVTGICDPADTNGFTRVGMGVAPGNTAANYTYTGTGTSYFYIWGLQVELGSFATSYIPTTSASVTRAADVVTCAGTVLSTFNGATGSCVTITSGWSSFNGTEASVAGGANRQLTADTSTNTQVETYNGTTALTATIGGSGTLAANVVKTAMGWDGSGRSIVANNGTLATDANTVGTATGTVYLGSATGAGTTFMDGYIQRVVGWTTRQPDATLQRFTR